MTEDDARHGTTAGFHAGCRDLCCRRAYGRYEKRGKVRRSRGETWAIPALGTQRRIQALMALGWTSTDIANACGWDHRNYLMRVLNGQKGKPTTWVQRKTHNTIEAAYDLLSMQVPPPAAHRARTRAIARRKGYAPPLCWNDIDNDDAPDYGGTDTDIDPVVVMRLLEGQRVTSTKAEKEAAMARWVADGNARAELCAWHGWKTGRYSTPLRLVEGGAA